MIPIIDLFAGPGGLNEGFSSLVSDDGSRVFTTIMSVEMDKTAHQTLRLRAFYRSLIEKNGRIPEAYLTFLGDPTAERLGALIERYPDEWSKADEEAVCAELKEGKTELIEKARERLRAKGVEPAGNWVLIGGPPCQAYSLVGRSRRAHDATLKTDVKQTLYKCYLSFINELKPSVFIMENVKGMLSARHDGEGIFGRIKSDMEAAGYGVYSLTCEKPENPADYVVKAENFGIPQARHRVILLGIRKDVAAKPKVLSERKEITLSQALAGIPKIRSGFSRRSADQKDISWRGYVKGAIIRLLETAEGASLANELEAVIHSKPPKKMSKDRIDTSDNVYQRWYRGFMRNHKVLPNHEARTHLALDIDRYLFCAAYAQKHSKPAKLHDFPDHLIPNHRNALGVKEKWAAGTETGFSDRFRVQLADKPSTTITSHISKDGHYYIHPDPNQGRSLTVREAARLQTFPDDYFFMGNRTAQYQQVGNAVPPLLAQQIAQIVAGCLGIQTKCFFDL